MLLSCGGRNCWGFKGWMEINMCVGKKVSTEISLPNTRVVPVMCFEGANASGKTCGLRVLSFIYDFCLNSFQYPADSQILYDTFFNNENKSDFFISFKLDKQPDTEYTYELTLDKSRVHQEKLTSKNKDGKKILLKRKNNRILINELCQTPDGIIYKPTASSISTLYQYGVKEIEPFIEFFKHVNSNVSYVQTRDDPMTDYAARYYSSHKSIHKRVVKELRRLDTGINAVEILTTQDTQGQNIYMSLFSYDNIDETKKLYFSSQSNGTKLLYNRLKDFFIALDTGGVLIFDEIDAHIHSDIVPHLLNYFLDPSLNPNNAQLIFTSHSTSIMNTLKKYRLYLFKKISGESICYRVDELETNRLLRNDRSLEQMYKTGELGGIPDVK